MRWAPALLVLQALSCAPVDDGEWTSAPVAPGELTPAQRALLRPDEPWPYDLGRPDAQRRLPVKYGGDFDARAFDRELDPARPRDLAVAKWLAWFSSAAYIDDFGPIDHPGALFAAFADMGFGRDGEVAAWVGRGLEMRQAYADCESQCRRDCALRLDDCPAPGRCFDLSFPGCARRDELDREMFTRLPADQGLGKLHGTVVDAARFAQGSTQVYFLHHPARNLALVAFRGTQPSVGLDLLADLDFDLVDFDDGQVPASSDSVQVFRGFRTALFERSGPAAAIDTLLARLRALPVGTRVLVTGHSLGGALANLFVYAALRDPHRPYSIATLTTFGAPPPGNAAFATHLNAALASERAFHMRFVLGGDPVPRLVDRIASGWFNRVTRGYFLGDLEQYRHATDLDPSGTVSQAIQLPCDTADGVRIGVRDDHPVCAGLLATPFDAIEDHGVQRYAEQLRQLAR